VSTNSTLAPDAAMVLGIASTAMPFARTPAAQAERWLRLLRQHGDAGVALQALGVGDTPDKGALDLDAAEERGTAPGSAPSGGPDDAGERDAVAEVSACAAQVAARRGGVGISTVDVLMAVMHVYGEAFDRVLQAHGTDRDTVLVLLGAQVREPATT
jgi:hypothetical protein